jgi:hypothetical protein
MKPHVKENELAPYLAYELMCKAEDTITPGVLGRVINPARLFALRVFNHLTFECTFTLSLKENRLKRLKSL